MTVELANRRKTKETVHRNRLFYQYHIKKYFSKKFYLF